LTALSTPIKSKGKRQRQTPLYFIIRKIPRIKQGRPQTPTKTVIITKDSPREQEKLIPLGMRGGEGTSQQASPWSPITFVRRLVTRSTSAKQIK